MLTVMRGLVAMLLVAASAPSAFAQPFHVHLRGGTFFGPGALNDALLPDGELSNLVLTGPLTGFIPFFNNGAEPPNVLGEIQQGGVVDGRLSDGVTLINENLDAGLLHLAFGTLSVLLVGVDGGPNDGVERYDLDDRGNLTLTVDVALDPGFPEGIIRLDGFRLATGTATVPLSVQTREGLPGGQDRAGSLPAGSVLIGRLGDFDQDGLLDGVLVSANDTPLDTLPAIAGAPMASIRPFFTDVPIAAAAAGFLAVNGIVQNFPEVTSAALATNDVAAAEERIADILGRLAAARENLRRALREHELAPRQARLVRRAQRMLKQAQEVFEEALERLEEGASGASLIPQVSSGFSLTGAALFLLPPPELAP